jgi:hypothetical protein
VADPFLRVELRRRPMPEQVRLLAEKLRSEPDCRATATAVSMALELIADEIDKEEQRRLGT